MSRHAVRRSLVVFSLIAALSVPDLCTALLGSRISGQVYRQPRRGEFAVAFMVAKSGGKLIQDETDFADKVLVADSPRPVMVFFTAPWCGPCRLSVPVVKDVMNEYSKQLDVVEVCTDDLPEVAAVSGVVSIPTIQLYFKGQLLDTIVGCVARNVLASSVNKVLEDTLGSAPNGDE